MPRKMLSIGISLLLGLLIVLPSHAQGFPLQTTLAVAWSPDGTKLAAGGTEGLRVIEVATWQDLPGFAGSSPPVYDLAWSPDGSQIAVAENTKTRIWDANNAQVVLEYEEQFPVAQAIAWSPDGLMIAGASYSDGLHIWSTLNADLVSKNAARDLYDLAWNPDSNQVVTGGGAAIEIWDVSTANLLVQWFGHGHEVITVAWSPDGSKIATGSLDNTVKIWDAFTQQELFTFSEHTRQILSISWSPDNTKIASAGIDGSIRIEDVISGETIQVIQAHAVISSVAFSPEGSFLAYGGEGGILQIIPLPPIDIENE